MTSKWVTNSKLSNRQIGKLIDYFVLEVSAIKAAKMLEINRHSSERVYHIIRVKLSRECENETPFGREIEVDESYFGGSRKGQSGRGAAGKVPVFGILRRNGKVYTRIVDNVSHKTLRKIIRTKVIPRSVIYSDRFHSYDGLVLDGFKHFRINHDEEFSNGKGNHINGIENFWGYVKTKLKRYYGVSRTHYYLYLKEMEFRFNHRNKDLRTVIRNIFKRNY
jgi:transposase